MIANESYQKKFELLMPLASEILNAVRKELKTDCLKNDYKYMQKHFSKKALNKLTHEEIAAAYIQEIQDGNEAIAEKIATQWIFRNGEVYQFFAHALSKHNPNIEEIKEIPEQLASQMIEQSVSQFGAINTYAFSVLNRVVFSQGAFDELKKRALVEKNEKKHSVKTDEVETVEELKKKHEAELSKLIEKYEQKLLGAQKKYTMDVEGLKKQIGGLQRKLASDAAR